MPDELDDEDELELDDEEDEDDEVDEFDELDDELLEDEVEIGSSPPQADKNTANKTVLTIRQQRLNKHAPPLNKLILLLNKTTRRLNKFATRQWRFNKIEGIRTPKTENSVF